MRRHEYRVELLSRGIQTFLPSKKVVAKLVVLRRSLQKLNALLRARNHLSERDIDRRFEST